MAMIDLAIVRFCSPLSAPRAPGEYAHSGKTPFAFQHIKSAAGPMASGARHGPIAFRRFQIPDALIEKHGYAPLTREVKEKIFGLNAAGVFDVDVNAKRNEIPEDYLSQIKMAYLDEGSSPSHRWYGWVAA